MTAKKKAKKEAARKVGKAPKRATKKGKAAAKRPAGATTREGRAALACAPGEDAMGFEIRWSPATTEATLKTLHDNLRLKASNATGRGVIALRYCATRAVAHGLDWILIATKPVSGLTASAQVNGGPVQSLAKSPGPQLKWSGRGDAR